MIGYLQNLIHYHISQQYSLSGIRLFVLLALLIPNLTYATIRIDYPSERAVYQRDVTGYGTITVAGSYTGGIDKVEVRAVPVYPGQGTELNWTPLSTNPQGGVFSGEVRLFGGWYTLLVRGSLGGVEVEQTAVSRMGIGEVFIICGQSNAQGIRGFPVGPPAEDERVNYITNNQNSQSSLADPNPPSFAHLASSDAHLSPMGQGAWCWGTLGDRLVQKLNVPILFINASWEGTSIRNWTQSANNQPTSNEYGGFLYPPSMPYANLSISVRNYANMHGLRSILWMQGETDTYPARTSKSDYATNLQYLINKLMSDTGRRIIWTIARTSRTSTNYEVSGGITSQAIIDAQNEVLSVPFNPVHPGPETDGLGNPRPDGIHFGTRESLIRLGEAWDAVLDVNYFASITPINPAQVPYITAKCAENNTSATLELPEGFSSYLWSNGATSRSITITSPGTYSATVKAENGMTLVTTPARVESVKPATPAILPAADPSICAASELEFSINGVNDYTWMKDGTEVGRGIKFGAAEAGTYTVRAQNPIGCVSDVSGGRVLTVLPEVTKPVVSHAGPFSLLADIEVNSADMKYKWLKNGLLLPNIETQVYKVGDLAPGESGSYQVQAFARFSSGIGSQTITCESELSDPLAYSMNSSEDVVVFPVPAKNGEIFVESREEVIGVTATLYDLMGKTVSSSFIPRVTQRESIKFPVSAGVYILKIEAGDKEYLKRVVFY